MRVSDILLFAILIISAVFLWKYICDSKQRKKEIETMGNIVKAWTDIFSEKHMALLIEEMRARLDEELTVVDGKAVKVDSSF